MKNQRIEIVFLLIVIAVSLGGFWGIFLGPDADPTGFHFLHLITSLTWLCLILLQLIYFQNKKMRQHRNVGLSIFIIGPLIFATGALLTVHSAHKEITAGEADLFVMTNIMVTLELGLIVLMAFSLRRNRKLHGNLILSSALLFLSVGLFFFLLSFIPQFKIEGPETFYRFTTAAVTSRWICAIIGVFFFLRNKKNGWPWLLVGSFPFINELINKAIEAFGKFQVITEFVGNINMTFIFVGSLVVYTGLLAIAWNSWKNKKNIRRNIS